jgi:hypothetical protein
MNKIIIWIFIGIVFICLNYSCNPHPDYDLKFDIINKSDSAVFFVFSFSYPDTTLSDNTAPNLWQKILAHDGKNETAGVFNINPTTLVFILDAHTVETTSWDSIVKHYMVLKRYQLTKSDMEKNKWIITYP